MPNNSALGTLTMEDIYGVGSIDTLSNESTQGKTNPSEGGGTDTTKGGKSSIFDIKGNFLGQPIMVWFGLIALLVVLKYVVEMPQVKRTLGA